MHARGQPAGSTDPALQQGCPPAGKSCVDDVPVAVCWSQYRPWKTSVVPERRAGLSLPTRPLAIAEAHAMGPVRRQEPGSRPDLVLSLADDKGVHAGD